MPKRTFDPEKDAITKDIYNSVRSILPEKAMSYNLLDIETPARNPQVNIPKRLILPDDKILNLYRKENLSEHTINFVSQFNSDMQENLLEVFKNLHSQTEELEVCIVIQEMLEDRLTKFDAYIKYDYITTPVSMGEFIESPNYLDLKTTIFPVIKRDLIKIFSDKNDIIEIILTGGIGWGKSNMAAIMLARMLYELSCLKEPQVYYGQERASTITLINMSVSLSQAMKSVYSYVRNMIRRSPYFRKQFQPDPKVESELRFPRNIILMATTNPIGYNVFGGVLDEINFMQVSQKSSRYSADREGVYDHARIIYQSLSRRQKSRFMKYGQVFGKLVLSSSKQYPDDFLERRIKEVKDDKNILVLDYPEWGTKDPKNYCGKTFKVLIGDLTKSSCILKDDEVIQDTISHIIDVPIEYHRDFERDPESSIRDIAGISVLAIEPFLTQRHKIFECIDKKIKHPFTVQSTTMQDGASLIRDFLSPNKTEVRYAHVDLALTKDAAGICIGHICGEKEVIRRSGGSEYAEKAPVVRVDLILQIVAPQHGEIMIADVRNIFYQFFEMGYEFGKITYDSYQSREGLQELQRRGYVAELRSVEDYEPYHNLKLSIYENRLVLYEHQQTIKELMELEHNKKKNKVDHRPNGAKDCISGDTKISLLSGKDIPIKDLVNKEFWVYASTKDGKVVPARAYNVHKVGKLDVMRIYFDNGSYLDCTSDHEIMLRNGKFIAVGELKIGDSLMPLYSFANKYLSRARFNHKVIKIENLKVKRDVYDMTVDTYHNFAVSSGVFVHNCADALCGMYNNCLEGFYQGMGIIMRGNTVMDTVLSESGTTDKDLALILGNSDIDDEEYFQ